MAANAPLPRGPQPGAELTVRNDERSLLHATVRLNATIFGVILGVLAGIALVVLALVANAERHGHAGLAVALLGVFLPGYGRTLGGVLAGLVWGVAGGFGLGAGIYWINYRSVLGRAETLAAGEAGGGEFPRAVLRLHGPSLGLALGTVGALGLVVTTSWLVLRGTAGESVRARLLGQVLPGYTVTYSGSLVGAIELFAVIFVCCIILARVYNAIAAWRAAR